MEYLRESGMELPKKTRVATCSVSTKYGEILLLKVPIVVLDSSQTRGIWIQYCVKSDFSVGKV